MVKLWSFFNLGPQNMVSSLLVTIFTILSVCAPFLTFEYLLSYFLGPLGSVVPPSGHKTWILSTFLEGKAIFGKKLIFTKSEKNIFSPIGKRTLKVFLGQPNNELQI